MEFHVDRIDQALAFVENKTRTSSWYLDMYSVMFGK